MEDTWQSGASYKTDCAVIQLGSVVKGEKKTRQGGIHMIAPVGSDLNCVSTSIEDTGIPRMDIYSFSRGIDSLFTSTCSDAQGCNTVTSLRASYCCANEYRDSLHAYGR